EVPLAMLRTTPIPSEANHEYAVVLDPDRIAHVPREDVPVDDRSVAVGRKDVVRQLDVLLDTRDPATDDLIPTDPGLRERRYRVDRVLGEQRGDLARNVRDPSGPVRLHPAFDGALIHAKRVRDDRFSGSLRPSTTRCPVRSPSTSTHRPSLRGQRSPRARRALRTSHPPRSSTYRHPCLEVDRRRHSRDPVDRSALARGGSLQTPPRTGRRH